MASSAAASAAEELAALSLAAPASLASLLPLLHPASAAAQLRTAHLALAQLAGLSFSTAPTPPATPGPQERIGAEEGRVLRDALASSAAERLAALRALGILAGLAPDVLLPLLATLLPSLLDAGSAPDHAALLIAAFLSTLASHAAARAALREHQAVGEWCDGWLDTAELGGGGKQEASTKDIALLAGLARVKLGPAAAPTAPPALQEEEIGSAEAKAEAKLRAQEKRNREKEAQREWERKEVEELRASLLALAKARLLLSHSHKEAAAESKPTQEEAGLPFDEEIKHATFMAALEALAHLSAHMKQAIVSDAPLLERLCSPSLLGSSVSRRPVFPQRLGAAASGAPSSSYEADPTRPASRTADGAALYALASILCALVAPPPILSAQEAQLAALRAKASNVALAPREDAAAAEARALKVLAAGGAATLVRLVAHSTESKATQEACASAFLGLAAPQTRASRAQIAREGGAKALLALCSLASSSSSASSEAQEEQRATLALLPMQALARLCISLPTPALFNAPAAPLRPLARLFLDALASPLQRFEACLALTNLASLPRLAGDVAKASHEGVSVEQALRERIVAAHRMERRAAVELLCNLAQDEQVRAIWSGEVEDEAVAQGSTSATTTAAPAATASAAPAAAAKGRLHVLLALCAPSASADEHDGDEQADAEQGTATESTLQTRLAASGALATLLSSPSACRRLLSLRASSLAILARLLEPTVEPRERAGARIRTLEEEEEEQQEKQAREKERLAEAHDAQSAGEAQMEHVRRDLRLRAAAAMGCVAQYAAWLRQGGGSDGGAGEAQPQQQLRHMQAKLGAAAWLEALRQRQAEKGDVGAMCHEALGLFASVGVQ
jgi:hypothetical protein